jgi:hypothetical protein
MTNWINGNYMEVDDDTTGKYFSLQFGPTGEQHFIECINEWVRTVTNESIDFYNLYETGTDYQYCSGYDNPQQKWLYVDTTYYYVLTCQGVDTEDNPPGASGFYNVYWSSWGNLNGC